MEVKTLPFNVILHRNMIKAHDLLSSFIGLFLQTYVNEDLHNIISFPKSPPQKLAIGSSDSFINIGAECWIKSSISLSFPVVVEN